jgi:UMF1 family MFS transporter
MGIYVTNEVGFTAAEASLVMKVAIVCAAAGGFGWGFVVDRIGPKRTLRVVLVLWMITLAWAAVVGFARLPGAAFWPVPLLAGVALGGTWAADRPFMLRLTPPERIGEFYGLYGMMGRFGAMTGPFVWALVADGLDLGRPAAITALLLFVVGSLVVIRRVPEGREAEFSTRA